MNGRMYDPVLGRMLSPDPFVPDGTFTQDFNRYSYARNNPLVYTDPDGEFIIASAIIVGSIFGMYTGYKIAESKGYDVRDWQTWGFMLGGGIIGGVSGYYGATIATGGGFLANTMGIMSGSFANSMGMSALSGGSMPPSISFGAASYGFGTGEWGYLGKKGNKWYQDLAYSFGALGNLQDIVSGFWGGDYQYQYEKEYKSVGHANIREVIKENDGSIQTPVKISVANRNPILVRHSGLRGTIEYAWKSNFRKYSGGPEYWLDVPESGFPRIPLNLNSKIVNWMAKNLSNDKGLWGIDRTRFGINYGCVSYAARALWTTGVPTIPVINYLGPWMLWSQLAVRQTGMNLSLYLYE